MKKKWLSLLLALSLMISLLVIPAQADSQLDGTGTLTGDTATLTISADKTAVAVGAQDVYVTFTVTLTTASGNTHGIPAFSFVLNPSDGLVLATEKKSESNSEFYYQTDPEGKIGAAAGGISAGEYKYTALAGGETPSRYFGAAGLNGAAGIGADQTLTVMKIVGKIPAGTAAAQTLTVYTDSAAAKDNFTAGIANGDQCKRVVVPAAVTVNSGVTVSGTLKLDNAAVTDITSGAVELYQGGNKVATADLDKTTGTYSFANVSTGSYTVKAVDVKASGKTLNGSADVTVDSTSVTGKDVPVQQWAKGDVNMDGIVNGQDLQRLYEHLNGSNPLAADDVWIGNVNGDDTTNGQDLQRLYEHLNGSNPMT